MIGFALLALLAPISAQTAAPSTTATSSSTGSQAQQSQLLQWVFPIAGLSDDPSAPWGVDVSAITSDGRPDPNSNTLRHLAFSSNSSLSPQDVTSTQSIYSSATSYGPDNSQSQMWIPAIGGNLNLGPNNNLTVSTPTTSSGSTISIVNNSFTALPFGLNLGRANAWNGSLVFGGSYDTNRLADRAWHKLPGAPNSFFVVSGREEIGSSSGPNVTVGRPPPGTQQRVILDFTSDAVTLTPGASVGSNCGQSLPIAISGASWSIDGALLQAPNRCTQNDPSVPDGTVILGKPFFQATYLYADADSSLYIAQAGSMNLPPNPTPFASSQPIKSAPSSPPAPSPSSKSTSGASPPLTATVTSYGAHVGIVVLALLGGLGVW